MKDQKAALIDAMYEKISSNEKAKEQFMKEFKVDEKSFEKMAKKMLDMWLDSPELIMFLSEMLGVYADIETGEGDEEDQDYLG